MPIMGGEGICAVDGGMYGNTTIEVDPLLLSRIAQLEAMVMDLTAKMEEMATKEKDAPQKWDPAMHAATQEEMMQEIAKRAQEQADYDEYLKGHYERLEEEREDPNKAYERAMDIL